MANDYIQADQRRQRALLLVALAITCASGCENEQQPPVAYSGPLVIESAGLYISRINGEPTSATVFPPKAVVEFNGTFDIADDRETIGTLSAQLIDPSQSKEVQIGAGSCQLPTRGTSSPTFTFGGTIELPRKPGRYKLRIVAASHGVLVGEIPVTIR